MTLAAGYGARLRPVTDSLPKPLIPVGGRPLIEHTLTRLKSAGVDEVAINLHHLPEIIRETLGDGSRFGLAIHYRYEPEILGTGGGVANCSDLFGDDPFFLVNSDILFDFDFDQLAERHQSLNVPATLALRTDANSKRYGTIDLGPDGLIKRILGRPRIKHETDWTETMFPGIQIIEPELLKRIPKGRYVELAREVYIRALEDGLSLGGRLMTGYWNDLGTPERFLRAMRDLFDGCVQGVRLSPSEAPSIAVQPVRIHAGAQVPSNCVLGPYVEVNPGAILGARVKLRNAIVLPGAIAPDDYEGENVILFGRGQALPA